MCRIITARNPNLNVDEIKGLMDFLVSDSGGDGSGFMWDNRGSISARKSSNWRASPHATKDYAKILRGLYDLEKTVVWHTRKASVGGFSTEFNHPVSEEAIWEHRAEGEMACDEVSQAIVHNGTMDKDELFRLKTMITIANPEAADRYKEVYRWSDTQLFGFLAYHYGLRSLYHYDRIGVIVEMLARDEGQPSQINVLRNDDRSLYITRWEEDSWMIMSNIPHDMYSILPDVRRFPRGLFTVEQVLGIYDNLKIMDKGEFAPRAKQFHQQQLSK